MYLKKLRLKSLDGLRAFREYIPKDIKWFNLETFLKNKKPHLLVRKTTKIPLFKENDESFHHNEAEIKKGEYPAKINRIYYQKDGHKNEVFYVVGIFNGSMWFRVDNIIENEDTLLDWVPKRSIFLP